MHHHQSTHKRNRSNKSNDMLLLPDFESDAAHHAHQNSSISTSSLIDERIRQLSYLFSATPSGYRRFLRSSTVGRFYPASELDLDQIASVVLNDEAEMSHLMLQLGLMDKIDNKALILKKARSRFLKELHQLLELRKQDERGMAKAYIDRRARANHFPWGEQMHGQNAETTAVHIDVHGRLRRGNVGNALEGGREIDDLVDVTEIFWNQHNNDCVNDSAGSTGRTERQNVSQNMPQNQALHNQAPIQPQNMQQLSQQMERDAKEAIERAIERYRRQDTNERVYELVHVPMVEPDSEDDSWLLWGNPREDNNNNNAHNNNNNANNNNNPQQQNRPRPDMRLAFRRICLAVLTVVAAFTCTLFQDLNTDLYEADWLWASPLKRPSASLNRNNKRSKDKGRRPRRQGYQLLNQGKYMTDEEMERMERLLEELFEEQQKVSGGERRECVWNDERKIMNCGVSVLEQKH